MNGYFKTFAACCALMAGCSEMPTEPGATAARNADYDQVVWAVNVGGPAYSSSDGIDYVADQSVSGELKRNAAEIKGSQDPMLYKTYREGDVRVSHPLPNGRYSLIFHFAEPDDQPRLFDVLVGGTRVIEAMDVRGWRDGKRDSGLTVAVADIEISDGQLLVETRASAGRPLLNALVVRRQATPPDDWELVWSDEFDRDGAPDPDRWNVELWPPGKVNNEMQAYTAREKNLIVRDGQLHITALKESFEGAEYTSARIQSQDKGDVMYGRIEVRAKLPYGQGTWPAIWMLPSDPFRYATTCEAGTDWQGNPDCDAWPNSGEIDIMEHVGYQMGHVHGTVHTKSYFWAVWEQRKGRLLVDKVDETFHVYALEWTPERIDIFVDDVRYFTYMNEGDGWQSWPFDQPFHLIMNVAVGGAWGLAGGPVDERIFPQTLSVDYVRVYRAR